MTGVQTCALPISKLLLQESKQPLTAGADAHQIILYAQIIMIGITIKGKITRTALLLLGKSEAKYFFDGFIPRITWTLYNADNSVKAYEHFDIPMLMAVDKVYSRIRNVKYRYIAGQILVQLTGQLVLEKSLKVFMNVMIKR